MLLGNNLLNPGFSQKHVIMTFIYLCSLYSASLLLHIQCWTLISSKYKHGGLFYYFFTFMKEVDFFFVLSLLFSFLICRLRLKKRVNSFVCDNLEFSKSPFGFLNSTQRLRRLWSQCRYLEFQTGQCPPYLRARALLGVK